MFKFYNFILLLLILYSCSPINKQHGYLLDDFLVSSEKISKFEVKNTTKNDVFNAMGSPSIEIQDVENVWIYLLSLKERKVFDEDELLFQSIYRFEFDNSGILIEQTFLTADNFNKIAFSSDETRVERNAYGITDQLYDAFTRGQ